MSKVLEAFLFHGLDVYTLEISEDGITYYEIERTAPEPFRTALATWSTAMNAHASLTGTYNISYETGNDTVTLRCTTNNFWYRLTDSLADALGYASTTGSGTDAYLSTLEPKAIWPDASVSYDAAIADEEVTLREYRHARAYAYPLRNSDRMRLTCWVGEDEEDRLFNGPLLGHGKVRFDRGLDATAYSASNLDGVIDCYPFNIADAEQIGGKGGLRRYRIDATLETGTPTFATSPRRFSELAEALPYGMTFCYHMKVEGIPVLTCERVYDLDAPTNWTLDASLVVDDSAKLGSIIDREKKGIGAGFDLSFRWLDTSTVRALFGSPTKQAVIREDEPYDATVFAVTDSSDWSANDRIYFMNETATIVNTTTSPDTFTGVARGLHGRRKDVAIGTVITDKPRFWRGREVELHASLVDPFGRIVTNGAGLPTPNVISYSAVVWKGHLVVQPTREQAEWSFRAASLERRLDTPLGMPISGKARWSRFQDRLVAYDPNQAFEFEIRDLDVIALGADPDNWSQRISLQFKPWGSVDEESTGYAWLSTLRQAIVDAWGAFDFAAYNVGAARWQRNVGNSTAVPSAGNDVWDWESWTLTVDVDPPTTTSTGDRIFAQAQCRMSPPGLYGNGVNGFSARVFNEWHVTEAMEFPDFGVADRSMWLNMQLLCMNFPDRLSLRVTVERGTPADIPSTGFVRVTHGDEEIVMRYSDVVVLSGAQSEVALFFEGEQAALLGQLQRPADDSGSVSVDFLFLDTGSVEDVMRRMLMSGGNGINGTGTYDTLLLGQGYDYDAVDEDSYDEAMDGAFLSLSMQLAVGLDHSFTKLFGGLLTLSQRAVVPLEQSDGSDVQLTALQYGAPTTAVRVATIDASVLAVGARTPHAIRPRQSRSVPNIIEVDCKDTDKARRGRVTVNDFERRNAQGGLSRRYDAYGFTRDVIREPTIAWAQAMFATAEIDQVVEIDVVPWLDVQVGDVVEIDLDFPGLFNFETSTAGYAGLGRVIGRQLHVQTGVTTLLLLLRGSQRSIPLSPSTAIIAYGGTAANPTSIEISDDYSAVFEDVEADAGGSFYVRVYEPGNDTSYGRLTVTNVADPSGGRIVLTTSGATGTVDASAQWVTWPDTADSTDEQDNYLHTDTTAVWV